MRQKCKVKELNCLTLYDVSTVNAIPLVAIPAYFQRNGLPVEVMHSICTYISVHCIKHDTTMSGNIT